jgi:hypothetical protein
MPNSVAISLVLLGTFLAACSQQSSANAKATKAPTSPRAFHEVKPGRGPAMTDLTLDQRSEIARIQSSLKAEYRDSLRYTIAADGRLVVVLPYEHGTKTYSFVVSSCHTPTDPSVPCRHDCGLGFVEQFWELQPLMETGRCQDGAPVWLNPRAPLPPFEPGTD